MTERDTSRATGHTLHGMGFFTWLQRNRWFRQRSGSYNPNLCQCKSGKVREAPASNNCFRGLAPTSEVPVAGSTGTGESRQAGGWPPVYMCAKYFHHHSRARVTKLLPTETLPDGDAHRQGPSQRGPLSPRARLEPRGPARQPHFRSGARGRPGAGNVGRRQTSLGEEWILLPWHPRHLPFLSASTDWKPPNCSKCNLLH